VNDKDSNLVAKFFSYEQPHSEINLVSFQKLCSIRNHVNSFIKQIKAPLKLNTVISELFPKDDTSIMQVKNICLYKTEVEPAVLLKITEGHVELDTYIIDQRKKHLLELAGLQKDNVVKEHLSLAASFECQIDKKTGKPFLLSPEMIFFTVFFYIVPEKLPDHTEYHRLCAVIRVGINMLLEYDLTALLVTITDKGKFQRKITSDEIYFLADKYQEAASWAMRDEKS